MSNELSDTEQKSILGLLRMGWSVRRIARETGHSREAISRYRTKVGLPTSNPASSPQVPADLSVPESSKPAGEPEVPTDSRTQEQATKIAGRSVCEPHRAFIADERSKGRNATAIYQDLVERYGYDASYDAVKRFVRTLEPPDESYAKCRFETEPGQEAQVDYGEGALTLDPRTGKYRKPRLFIMTLGCSRHAYRTTVWKSSQETWCKLHEDAFAYFGGTTLTMRLDNLREGVIAPDIYDPELNALYAAVLNFYNVVALPCRPYAPDAKGKVESAVGYTQRTALKGRRFENLDAQNAFLLHWNETWAATRIHGTTKRQVRAMFEQERPALQALPTARFEYYSILERRVHLDAHIEVAGAYYSAPPRYVGRKVIVHAGNPWLRIIDEKTKQCIREHAATHKGSRRTNDEDRPKQTPRAVLDLVESIAYSGPSCATFAQTLVAESGALAARSLYGLLSCIKQHGAETVEHACGIAVRMGALRLRFVRVLLSRKVTSQPLIDEHPLIEAIATYSSHFHTVTQGELFNDN